MLSISLEGTKMLVFSELLGPAIPHARLYTRLRQFNMSSVSYADNPLYAPAPSLTFED